MYYKYFLETETYKTQRRRRYMRSNKNSLKVSWDKVFVNCQKKDVKGLQVRVDTEMNDVTETIRKDALLEENEIILDRRPCTRHTVSLKLVFNHEHILPLESTTDYNKNSGPRQR